MGKMVMVMVMIRLESKMKICSGDDDKVQLQTRLPLLLLSMMMMMMKMRTVTPFLVTLMVMVMRRPVAQASRGTVQPITCNGPKVRLVKIESMWSFRKTMAGCLWEFMTASVALMHQISS